MHLRGLPLRLWCPPHAFLKSLSNECQRLSRDVVVLVVSCNVDSVYMVSCCRLSCIHMQLYSRDSLGPDPDLIHDPSPVCSDPILHSLAHPLPVGGIEGPLRLWGREG